METPNEATRWQQLTGLLAHLAPEQVNDLLTLLLSLDEQEAIGGRMAVFKALLEAEMSQRQIAATLNVSIATITRCSNNLKAMAPARREALAKLLMRDNG